MVDHKNTGAERFVTVHILLNVWSTTHRSRTLFLFKHLEKLAAEMPCLRYVSQSVIIPKENDFSFLENENDTVINKITAFVQIFAGCKKQKGLKSVLGEAISTEFDKVMPLCLETISNYSNVMERQGHSSGNTVAACLFAKNPHSRTWIEVKLFVSCTVRMQRLLSHRSTIILLL